MEGSSRFQIPSVPSPAYIGKTLPHGTVGSNDSLAAMLHSVCCGSFGYVTQHAASQHGERRSLLPSMSCGRVLRRQRAEGGCNRDRASMFDLVEFLKY